MSNNVYAFTLQTAQITGGNPETVVNDATAQNPQGALMKWSDNVYRYVQFSTGSGVVAGAAGGVSHWKTLTIVNNATTPSYLVTSDQTDALSNLNSVSGILKGVITTLYYTWIGVGGVHTCLTASGTATTDSLIASVVDLTFGKVGQAATTNSLITYGAVIAAQVGGVSNNCLLNNLIW